MVKRDTQHTARCLQEAINEIHGSWFGPANPVVKYDGSLHQDAFPWMQREAREADLVLVMGTSLSGLNADQARPTARRPPPFADGAYLSGCLDHIHCVRWPTIVRLTVDTGTSVCSTTLDR